MEKCICRIPSTVRRWQPTSKRSDTAAVRNIPRVALASNPAGLPRSASSPRLLGPPASVGLCTPLPGSAVLVTKTAPPRTRSWKHCAGELCDSAAAWAQSLLPAAWGSSPWASWFPCGVASFSPSIRSEAAATRSMSLVNMCQMSRAPSAGTARSSPAVRRAARRGATVPPSSHERSTAAPASTAPRFATRSEERSAALSRPSSAPLSTAPSTPRPAM
mmetsp:Transcript_13863/g.39248  ORF Transcript_13863/g.39248 Transcript_13863/m.39248 type:complete len:218 (+) Transcript_13863:190-843(+)